MKKLCTLFVVFTFGLSYTIFAQAPMFKTGMLLDATKPKGIEVYDFDAMGFGETLPDSISLVEYAPYPSNQGNYSTCVGWAYGYCATSILYAQKYNIKNRTAITALAMCPFSIYNKIKDPYDATCSKGTYLHLAAAELQHHGTKRFHLNEIGCNESSSKDTVYRIFKVDNTYAIWDLYQGKDVEKSVKILNTKKALAAKDPVLIGFRATYSFCYDISSSDGFWRKDASNLFPVGGHAMCVVGYNDKKFGGAFLLQNSWGKEWGQDGYAWVSYDDYAEYTITAYVIELESATKTSALVPKVGCEYGDCLNKYSRYRFKNGDVYEGDVKDGRPHGNGIFQYKNGDVFTGAFKTGKKEGKGTYYFADGTTKAAYWQADTINEGADYLEYGYGTITNESSKFKGYYKGEKWIFGNYSKDYSSYASDYTGKFLDGKKDDFGIRTYPSYLYIGSYKDDANYGVYAFIGKKSKHIYIYNTETSGYKPLQNSVELASKVTSFSESTADSIATTNKKYCTYGDCENGYGKYTYPSGNTYEGFFMNGYRNGYGIYTLKAGGKICTYEGVYTANKRNGLGKITMAEGNVFIGEFSFNKKEGYGIYTTADGKVLAGIWEKNSYVEWEEDLGYGDADAQKSKDVQSKTDKKNKYTALPQSQFKLE